MNESHITHSIHKAALETTRVLSSRLRSEARASNWPDDVVRHMRVSYTDGEFHVHSHNDHKGQVLNLEYGTPDTLPTAAIRRFSNRTKEAEQFFMGRLGKHLESL